MDKEIFEIHYISTSYGVSREEVIQWIEIEIIHPYNAEDLLFDLEDLQRIRLICDLKEYCDPNKESLQTIMHLIDQLNYYHNKTP